MNEHHGIARVDREDAALEFECQLRDKGKQRSEPANGDIAERHDPGIDPLAAGQNRPDDSGAEIDAEDQRNDQHRRNQRPVGERCQQQDGGDTGMKRPGEQCGKDKGGDPVP